MTKSRSKTGSRGAKTMASDATVNIIRKIEVVEGHGHHGGAWKVAYADFMTAMMAFFLLMWILSSSDEQKLRGIAEYFTNATLPGGSGVLDGATLGPPGTLTASNGSTVARGAEFGEEDDPSPAKWEVMDTTPTADPDQTARGSQSGHHENPAGGAASPVYDAQQRDDAAVTSDNAAGQAQMPTDSTDPMHAAAAKNMADSADSKDMADMNAAGDVDKVNPDHSADEQRFEEMKAKILQAMQASPDLAPLQENLMFEKTPDGMMVQIVDQRGKAMFSSGSSKMNAATVKLMRLLGESLTQLPNEMVISGHTDAVPFSNSAGYDNWDLSSDRANAMRRVLLQSGVTHDRITRVSGMADTQLLKTEAPKDPSNRRIEVLLAYEQPAMAAPMDKPMEKPAMTQKAEMADSPAMTPTSEMAATDMMEKPMDSPVQAEIAQELGMEKPVTVLDEKVFENLRSALR